MPTHHLNCPGCGMVDRVAKVSAVYSAGLQASELSGSTMGAAFPIGDGNNDPAVGAAYTQLSGSSQSDLSRKLSPPPQPIKPRGRGGCAIALLGLGVMLAIAPVGAVLRSIEEGLPSGFVALVVEAIRLLLGAVLLVVMALVCFYFGSRWKQEADEAYDAAMARYEAQLPAWRNALAAWKRLYYCARCDGVFEPGEGELYPLDELAQYLRKRANE